HDLGRVQQLKDHERAGPVAPSPIVVLMDLQLVDELSVARQVIAGARVPAPGHARYMVSDRHALGADHGKHRIPGAVIGGAYECGDGSSSGRPRWLEPATGNGDGGPFTDPGNGIEQRQPLLRLGFTLTVHAGHSAATTRETRVQAHGASALEVDTIDHVVACGRG